MRVVVTTISALAVSLCDPGAKAADLGKDTKKGDDTRASAFFELVGDPIVIADEAKYCAWTDLVRLSATGNLMVVYAAGSGHLMPDLAIHKRVSSDDGKTWSAPDTVVPALNKGYSVRDPHVIQLPDGTLLLNYFSFPEGPESCRVHLIRSTDNGQTWSKPMTINPGVPFVWMATCGKILVLKNGELLLPLYYRLKKSKGTVGILRSSDKGKTWRNLISIQSDNEDGEMEMDELPDGSLVALIRPAYVAFSKDKGKTWSRPRDTIALHAPGLLADGPLLLMNHRNKGYGSAALGLSLDGGKTWPVTKELCGGGADCAYGAIVKTQPPSPGAYFTAYYAPYQGSVKIVGRYFSIAQ
jgi:hypothetical protein